MFSKCSKSEQESSVMFCNWCKSKKC